MARAAGRGHGPGVGRRARGRLGRPLLAFQLIAAGELLLFPSAGCQRAERAALVPVDGGPQPRPGAGAATAEGGDDEARDGGPPDGGALLDDGGPLDGGRPLDDDGVFDGGAVLDGGLVVDGGGSLDGGAPRAVESGPVPDPGLLALVSEVAALLALVDGLERLVAGDLPGPGSPPSLLEVDPRDDAAVADRLEVLRARLADPGGTEGPALPLVREGSAAGSPTPDAGAPTARTPEARAPPDGASSDPSETDPAAETPPRAGAASSSPGPSPPDDDGPEAALGAVPLDPFADERARLRGERDRLARRRDALRIALLSRPAPERAALGARLDEQRSLREGQERAADALAVAEAEARSAERAKVEALAEAARAEVDAVGARIAAERARLSEARAEVAARTAAVAEERARLLDRVETWLEESHVLEQETADLPLGSSQVDAAFDAVSQRLAEARQGLDRALRVAEASTGEPTAVGAGAPPSPGADPPVPTEALAEGDPAAAAQLARSQRALTDAETRLAREREAFRRERVEALARRVERLTPIRRSLLDRASPSKRQRVLGLDPEGLAALRAELEQLGLMTRVWAGRLLRDLPDVPIWLAVQAASATTRGPLLWSFFLVAVTAGVAARRRPLETVLRAGLFRAARENRFAGVLARLWPALWDLGLHGALWLALASAFDAWGTLVDGPIPALLRVVVLGWAAWKFFARLAHHLIFAASGGGGIRAAVKRRMEASEALVAGWALVALVLPAAVEVVAGRGALYAWTWWLVLVAVAPVVVVLLRRHREPAKVAFLARHPSSPLAAQLQQTGSGLGGYLLVLPALLRLAGDGAVSVLRNLALRSEQSRRAVAFLFRRRLERRSESLGRQAAEVAALPAEVREAFDDGPVGAPLAMPHYPGLDPVAKELRAWKDGGPGLAVALSGERGIGKTAWLDELRKRAGVAEDSPVRALPRGAWEAPVLCRFLSEVLDLPDSADVESLCAAVEAHGVRRCVVLDQGQNAFLRTVGGSAGFGALVEVAARTEHQVAWVVSFARYGWQYLKRVEQAQGFFDHEVDLKGWSEDKIAQLIRRRMEHAGYRASFEDLLVESMEGTAARHAVIRTSEEFLRLLWDYADGNPRVALRFWLRSLLPPEEPGGRVLRVRLFDAPSADALEPLHEESRFLLAAVVVHENLSLPEAEAVLRLPRTRLAALFAYLESKGYLEQGAGSEAGRGDGVYRVSADWYRAVVRHLKRKRLLFD